MSRGLGVLRVWGYRDYRGTFTVQGLRTVQNQMLQERDNEMDARALFVGGPSNWFRAPLVECFWT